MSAAVTRKTFITGLALFAAINLLPACKQAEQVGQPAQTGQTALTPAEVRAIAKEAYIYGFPMVDSYRIQHAYFANPSSSQYKGPWNTLVSTPRVYTPADTAIPTPNSDTPYSTAGLDLRTEPMVITVPPIEKGRYYSVQLIDAYTHNFAYIGSRATGNNGGSYVVAGPGWKGEEPPGIDKVFRSETEFVLTVIRTQLFNPADLGNVKKIQAGYKLQPLSAFLGKPAPAAAPPIDFIKPLTPDEQKTSLEFFNILNFAMQYTPTVPSEQALRARFETAGIAPGKRLDATTLSREMKAAYEQGMADAQTEFGNFRKAKVDTGQVASGEMFGSREFLKNNYLYRMGGGTLGIFGNTKEEAMYPLYLVDAAGQPLDGKNKYTVRFAPGQLPPVEAFWSLTMYRMPESLLVANPINRYLINSPMLPQLVKDPDGGITLYIQNKSPGKDKEANWLPAPAGPFISALRLYWPKQDALDGKWKAPPMTKTS